MAELKDWGQFAREHPGAAIVLVNWDRHAAEPDRIASALAKAGLGSVQSLACSTALKRSSVWDRSQLDGRAALYVDDRW